MKKLLLLILILTIGCDKEETEEQSYSCECELFGVYAGTTGAESGGRIRLRECEVMGMIEEEEIRGIRYVRSGTGYEVIYLTSKQQNCSD